MRRAITVGLVFFFSVLSANGQGKTTQPRADGVADPAMLSFDDLVTPLRPPNQQGGWALVSTACSPRPSSATTRAPRASRRTGPQSSVRVGLWNIERGLNFELIRARLQTHASSSGSQAISARSAPRGRPRSSHSWATCKMPTS
jgi:hypothetical protein